MDAKVTPSVAGQFECKWMSISP